LFHDAALTCGTTDVRHQAGPKTQGLKYVNGYAMVSEPPPPASIGVMAPAGSAYTAASPPPAAEGKGHEMSLPGWIAFDKQARRGLQDWLDRRSTYPLFSPLASHSLI